MTDSRALLLEIERFIAKNGMAESTFGRKSVNDGKLVGRLKAGGSVTLESAAAIRRFMTENAPAAEEAPEAEACP